MTILRTPSSVIIVCRTTACSASAADVWNSSPESGNSARSLALAPGETTVTPAAVSVGAAIFASDDVSGPTTASTLLVSRSSTEAVTTDGSLESAESRLVRSTGWPSTPPAALMSCSASSRPAPIAGAYDESEPVDGSNPPTTSLPSPAREPSGAGPAWPNPGGASTVVIYALDVSSS